jgi:glycosyltransferase involved in cell wall biosynthesis
LPVIYSAHNTMGDELASYRFIRPRVLADLLARILDGFVPRIGNRCLPHSGNIERFLHGMGLRQRSEPVVNFGIDVEAMAQGDGAAIRRAYGLVGAPVIVYAGVLDQFQRLDLLFEALAKLLPHQPHAKLLLVVTIPHEGHIQRLRQMAQELGVTKSLIITNSQPLAEVRHHLAAGDVAVVPRPAAPGFPIKLLNYMAAKRPCVLFASSASYGLTHRQTAYLVAPDSGAALGQGILELLSDANLRERLAQAGYAYVRENHNRRVIAQRVCAAYSRTLRAAAPLGRSTDQPLLIRDDPRERAWLVPAYDGWSTLQPDQASQEVFCDVGA